MTEDRFVTQTLRVVQQQVKPPFEVLRGAALLYRVVVSHRLEITAKPEEPRRGQSAFQTDLCVFERTENGPAIPRVVLEFKVRLTTHDVLTYSTKARKHKQVYPYLRYGMILARDDYVPTRFFQHNESLDFCVAAGELAQRTFTRMVGTLVREEIHASKLLESNASGERVQLYRTEIIRMAL